MVSFKSQQQFLLSYFFLTIMSTCYTQVCDRSEEWKEGRFEENAQRFSESDVFEKGLQGTQDVVFFQA